MPTQNPEYNPDWKAIHDYHSAERARLTEELKLITKRDQDSFDAGLAYDSGQRLAIQDERERILAGLDAHQKASLESFRMQFPTVQEYAAWVFRTFDPATGHPEAKTPELDFEQFTTLDEVGEAWLRAHKVAEDEARATKARTAEISHKPS